jgi:hypothetical protein
MLACAEICRTSAFFMELGTEFHKRTCAVCAEVRGVREELRGVRRYAGMHGSLPPLCRELPSYGCLAGTRERQTLLLPARRQRPLQLLQHQRLVRTSREDLIDDVERQQRQPQDPADIALRDVRHVGQAANEGASTDRGDRP